MISLPAAITVSDHNHLYHIVTYWRELAGIHFRTQQRRGLHSLRHTLATQLLTDASPLPKIPSWKQNKTLLEWLHSL